jgi:ribonucleoside-diphosphate reductase alpha chain
MPLNDAYELIDSQSGLSRESLESAVGEGEIHVYDFGGESYLDRLDIGRVYHESPMEKEGIHVERYFSTKGENPLESVGPYIPRDLEIKDFDTGKIVYELKGAMFPELWDGDDNSQRIVAQKYFFTPKKEEWKGKLKEKIGVDHENSIAHLTSRVSNFFADKGDELGYFASEADKEAFRDELMWLQINRKGAFNSPVQFNFGIYNEYGVEGNPSMNYTRDSETGEVVRIDGGEFESPQGHACFINGPRDSLESIAAHNINEIGVFSAGSGIGQNIGTLRESNGELSGGGAASGPLSFLKGYDAWAGTIKSGGKSRRAARMSTMDGDHPDIMDFIRSKVTEDGKALALMEAGYSPGMDGEAFTTVGLQNTNITVRLGDYVFEQLEKGGDVDLKSVKTGDVVGRVSADGILKEMAFGTWRVGDPGIQYDDTIHAMHTAKNSGRQRSTNPCGEYMFIDDTSCNLASLNLLAFSDDSGDFDVDGFKRASRIFAMAQDIANDAASYPVKEIAGISPEFRTIGLGYANLGAFLMRNGLAYDSDEGRAMAGAITSIMTGAAYETSAELAGAIEPFTHYEFNKDSMMDVMNSHKKSLEEIAWDHVPEKLRVAASDSWDAAIVAGEENGYRNAQATLLAPTGTIAYLMGCDTTGVEPAFALSIQKDLSGGGTITLANKEVSNALKNLEYSVSEIEDIEAHIAERNTAIGAPHLNPDHYNVFATAVGNIDGEGAIPFDGHIGMVGAVQPFLSGGVSKTNNFPESATVKDIYDGFVLGHELGLKGLTAFRSNSKPVSALNFGGKSYVKPKRGEKVDLPRRRRAMEFEVELDGTPLHIIASEYEDGTPGQVTFLSYKSGSTLGALLTTSGIDASKALKRGVSLEDVTAGWIGQELEPKGLVHGHADIKTALSPLDLAAKLLRIEYMGETDFANDPEKVNIEGLRGFQNGAFEAYARADFDDWDINQVVEDPEFGGFKNGNGKKHGTNGNGKKKFNNDRGKICDSCTSLMIQTSANCYSCTNCGDKIGGCGQ